MQVTVRVFRLRFLRQLPIMRDATTAAGKPCRNTHTCLGLLPIPPDLLRAKPYTPRPAALETGTSKSVLSQMKSSLT